MQVTANKTLLDKGFPKAIQTASNDTIASILPGDWRQLRHPKSGDTVWHYLARYNRVDLMECLLETLQSGDFETTDNLLEIPNVYGKRPLHEAAQTASAECVEFLIGRNVDVDALKQADWTPLMLACTQNNTDVIEILLKAGADIELRNKDGWTAFHIACREGHIGVVSSIIKLSPFSQIWLTMSNNGRTPLHSVALHGHVSLAEWLIDKCYCHAPDTSDSCGTTPLMDAVRSGHVTLAKLLIGRHGASVMKQDKLGRQCLHISAQAGFTRAIEYLCVEMKVDVNAMCHNGNTPLHIAVWENHYNAVKLLMTYGADTSLTDKNYRTVLDTARLKNNQEIIDILKMTQNISVMKPS